MPKTTKKETIITVVIPAYNEEKYIENILKSLKKQTFKNFNIYIVDNNSTDKTVKIAKQYDVHVLFESKQGAVYAYNTGMRQSTGDIIVTTDADTEVPPQWLQTIANAFKQDRVVAITGTAKMISNTRLVNTFIRRLFSFFVYFNFILGKPHLNGFNMAVKRNAFRQVGGMNTNYEISFEVDLGLRLSKIGKVLFLKELCVDVSPRRWKKSVMRAFLVYSAAYFYTVWLRKPAPIEFIAIR